MKSYLSNIQFAVVAGFMVFSAICFIAKELINAKLVRQYEIKIEGINQPWKRAAEIEMARRMLPNGLLRKFLKSLHVIGVISSLGAFVTLMMIALRDSLRQ